MLNQERWLEEGADYWTPQPSTTGSVGDKFIADKGAGEQRYKKYMPFGDGMRACVGQSLAKMNYTTATALLLSHFTFRLAERVCKPSNCLPATSVVLWLALGLFQIREMLAFGRYIPSWSIFSILVEFLV